MPSKEHPLLFINILLIVVASISMFAGVLHVISSDSWLGCLAVVFQIALHGMVIFVAVDQIRNNTWYRPLWRGIIVTLILTSVALILT